MPSGDRPAIVPAPRSAIDLVVRFVDRIALLGPDEWGRLEACGDRLDARDPLARWQRARLVASLVDAPAPVDAALTALILGGSLVADVRDLLLGRPQRDASTDRLPPALPAAGEARVVTRELQRLVDLVDARTGGSRRALSCLLLAFGAVAARDRLSAPAFDRLYAPVAAVLPLATL